MIKDIMSVEYTELDNGTPALCFCSDIIIPVVNKTMIQSFINYIDNNLKFKIIDLHINQLLLTFINNDVILVKAKINNKYEQMGFTETQELYKCLVKVLNKLKEGIDE